MSDLKYPYRFDEHSLVYLEGTREYCGQVFKEFIDRPVWCLEIGVYQAATSCWLLDNILTHPRAYLLGIDDRPDLSDALTNLKHHPHEKWYLATEDSKKVLPTLLKRTFNLAYIDGDHSYEGCLADLNNVWPLIVKGGIILCDDYNRADYGVKLAVETFLVCLGPSAYSVMIDGYKFGFRKEIE